MRRFTAIAVIVSILAASAGELVHACVMDAMDVQPQPMTEPMAEAMAEAMVEARAETAAEPAAEPAAGMPCHGDGEQPEPSAPSHGAMDCCDDGSAASLCIDCLCTAVSMPLSALENPAPEAVPAPARHLPPLSAESPPERPPEYLLRPPIRLS